MTDPLHALTDIHTLEQLARDQGLEALDAALGDAIAALPAEVRVTLADGPAVGPRTLRMIRGALALDAAFLRRHPEALFQCLYNRLRWVDAPDAAEHFSPSDQGPWSEPDAHLHALAERWKRQRAALPSAAPWLEALRPLRGNPAETDLLLRGHEAQVLCAAFSPSGARLASGSWDDGDNLRVWDVATGECVQVLEGHECEVLDVAWSPDGKRLASGSRDHDVRVWDAETGELLHELTGQEGRVTSVAFSPDGRLVAGGNLGWMARLWDAESGEEVRKLEGHEQSVLSVSFHPSGRLLATGASDETARIWDIATGAEVAKLEAGTIVRSLAFSPDGAWLALTHDEGIALVETQGWTQARVIGGDGSYSRVTWLGDGKLGALAYNRLEVLDARSGAVLQTRAQTSDGHELHVAFHPGGQRFALTSEEGVVRVSDFTSVPGPTLDSDKDQVREVWSEPEAGLAVASTGLASILIEASGRVRTVSPEPMPAPGRPWAATPDGKLLAYPFTRYEEEVSRRGAVALMDVETLAIVRTLTEPASSEEYPNELHVAFSPDGRTVAAVIKEGEVRLWRVEDGAPLQLLKGHESPITLLQFTPDGAAVVSGSAEGSRLLVHDAKSGKVIVETSATLDPAVVYAAARKAPRIAVGRQSGELELFDLAAGSRRLVQAAEAPLSSVALTDDGKLAAACAIDGVVHVFDANTGARLHELPHPELPFRVGLGEGLIITLANDTIARFFDLGTGAPRAELQGFVDPVEALTQEKWVVLGDTELNVHRGLELEPRYRFHDPMEETELLRGRLLVGRGRTESNALYILRIHG